MKTTKEFIESGILELYVLGTASSEEVMEVEQRAAGDPEIRQEIDAISEALELYAMENAIQPNELIKPFLLATIDYTQRLENGEEVTHPPLLNEASTIEDYLPWLSRADMKPPANDLDLFAKIIGYTPTVTSAIVWINEYAPHEVHDDEFERFLIVEGTCEIIVEDEVNQLKPSDYFAIPLHKKHMVKVTSSIPCKVILQRIAA
jgi:mannose-6-phosphate isomerase-like protein (cupin superfamily)